MHISHVLISAEEWDLIARWVWNARGGTFWFPRWTVPISSGGAWPRSLPYCPADAANRRSVWITGPSGGWVPGALCARQCGPCPAFSPVSSWVPAAPRTGRSRQCDGRRVKPL